MPKYRYSKELHWKWLCNQIKIFILKEFHEFIQEIVEKRGTY